jgi:NAD(P)H-flavin reductase
MAGIAPAEFLCTVKSHRMLTPTTFELRFHTDKPFDFTAGQF